MIDHLCKNVCESCEEMCDWKCYDECENRFACSAKCFEDCRRPPCEKRCKKSLECSPNHRCIGLCGENCPKKCKRCDRNELSNCVESKNIDNSLFIELIKCGHVFEVETMDTHMNLHSKDDSCRDKQVALKKCPRCSTPIQRSGRYKVVFNQAYRDRSRGRVIPATPTTTGELPWTSTQAPGNTNSSASVAPWAAGPTMRSI